MSGGRRIVFAGIVVGAIGWSWLAPCAEAAAAVKPARTLKVFGDDEREVVADTTAFPWSAIGQVEAIWDRGDGTIVVSTGTGTLIGRRVVLTCGHCVYDEEYGWANRVVFIPGRNGDEEPFGRANVVYTVAQQAWTGDLNNDYDIAMMLLDEPLGEQTGYMSVAVKSDTFFENRSLNSAGYPGEWGESGHQYHAFGSSDGTEGNLVRHFIDSSPGQSGSPLWYYVPESDTRELVAVLTGSREVSVNGQVVDTYNVGIRITPEFATWIEETLTTHDGTTPTITTDASTTSTSAPVGLCGLGLAETLVGGVTGLWILGSTRRREA